MYLGLKIIFTTKFFGRMFLVLTMNSLFLATD